MLGILRLDRIQIYSSVYSQQQGLSWRDGVYMLPKSWVFLGLDFSSCSEGDQVPSWQPCDQLPVCLHSRLQEVNSMINKRLKDALFMDQWSELFMDVLSPFNFVLVRLCVKRILGSGACLVWAEI